MRRLALIALLTLAVNLAAAQRIGSAGPHFSGRYGRAGTPGYTPRYSPYLSPYALFSDPLFADSFYNAGYPVSSAPPVIVMQPPAPTSERAAAPAQPPSDPLMIELHGDQYVRIGLNNDSANQTLATVRTSDFAVTRTQPAALEPVVLIFRDGHREQVTDYTITDGVLYSQSDYYTSGSWNKKIDLSTLDVPQTISANNSRGVIFRLPTAPNQVITRP